MPIAAHALLNHAGVSVGKSVWTGTQVQEQSAYKRALLKGQLLQNHSTLRCF